MIYRWRQLIAPFPGKTRSTRYSVLGLLYCLSSLCCQIALGQNQPDTDIRFVHLGVDEGLSQSSVLSIVQDKRGFMWFGTRNGLNKYDTRTFNVYRRQAGEASPTLLSNDFISSLLSDSQNTLWIGSAAGLTKYSIADDHFEHAVHHDDISHSISSNQITSILETPDGYVWVGTSKGLDFLMDRHQNAFQTFLKDQHVYDLVNRANHSQVWVGTNKGLWLLTHHDSGQTAFEGFTALNTFLQSLAPDHVTSVAEDREGTLWIGMQSHGLIALDIANGQYQHYVEGQMGLPSNNIRKIITDRSGRLWVGTLKGLCIIDPLTGQTQTHQHDPDNPHSLSQNSIYDIYEDQQGIIWIGTYYGGVNVVYPQTPPFQVLQSSKYYPSLSSNVVSAIVEDANGNLWIGTEAEGLNYYDRRRQQFQHYRYEYSLENSISSNLIKTVHIDHDQQVWVGTFAGGLNAFDATTKTFRHYHNDIPSDNSLSNNVYSLLEDRQRRFWVGTNQGLFLFDKTTGNFSLFDPQLRNGVINCLIEDRHGNIWAGTSWGLYQLEPGTGRFELTDGIPGYIYCLYEDKKGDIWVGTGQNHLYRFDPHADAITHYGVAEGLPGNAVYGMLDDEAGQIWLSTNSGLCRLNPQTRQIHHYTVKDGLPGNEFNYNSFFKDSQGHFFFGSLNGLVRFRPEQISTNTYIPNIVFTGRSRGPAMGWIPVLTPT